MWPSGAQNPAPASAPPHEDDDFWGSTTGVGATVPSQQHVPQQRFPPNLYQQSGQLYPQLNHAAQPFPNQPGSQYPPNVQMGSAYFQQHVPSTYQGANAYPQQVAQPPQRFQQQGPIFHNSPNPFYYPQNLPLQQQPPILQSQLSMQGVTSHPSQVRVQQGQAPISSTTAGSSLSQGQPINLQQQQAQGPYSQQPHAKQVVPSSLQGQQNADQNFTIFSKMPPPSRTGSQNQIQETPAAKSSSQPPSKPLPALPPGAKPRENLYAYPPAPPSMDMVDITRISRRQQHADCAPGESNSLGSDVSKERPRMSATVKKKYLIQNHNFAQRRKLLIAEEAKNDSELMKKLEEEKVKRRELRETRRQALRKRREEEQESQRKEQQITVDKDEAQEELQKKQEDLETKLALETERKALEQEREKIEREAEERIRKEVEERLKLEQERMLKEVEEKLKREDEERQKKMEEELKRLREEEQEKGRQLLARMEEERKKKAEEDRREMEEKLKQIEQEREERRKWEERVHEEEQRRIAEKLEREKGWMESFTPEKWKQDMEARLRREMKQEDRKKREEDKGENEKHVWEFNPEEIVLGKLIGQGSFGVVHEGKLHGKEVAVKMLHTKDINEEALETFKKEVDIMNKLRHPNILLFMGACFEPDQLMLVTELMPRGSVEDLLQNRASPLSFKLRMKMAKDCALGMNWLHRLNPPFLHLDLKLGNLLVDHNWTVKVADFGLSTIYSPDYEGGELVGSPFYMAPEMLLQKEFNEKVDVYAFGVVLWELFTLEEPYQGLFETLEDLIDGVAVDEERPEIPDNTPPDLRDLITSCWHVDPDSRPSFNYILKRNLLDHIIIDAVIKDPMGQSFWKKYYVEQDVVEWKTLIENFKAFFCIPAGLLADNAPVTKALHNIIVGENGSTTVTMEAFGNALQWFGPLTDGPSFVKNVENITSKGWFFGDISLNEAESLLRANKKGVFLIRFSVSTPGSFTLSLMHSQKRGPKHVRINRSEKGEFLYGDACYASLDQFLTAQSRVMRLKAICPGTPFARFYLPKGSSNAQQHSYYESYAPF